MFKCVRLINNSITIEISAHTTYKVFNVPLTKNEELAAVIVPWGLIKAGFSLDICSTEEGLTPLSFNTVSGLPVLKKKKWKMTVIRHWFKRC